MARLLAGQVTRPVLFAQAMAQAATGADLIMTAGPGPDAGLTARVWRLYMAGSRLGFDRNHIELHQVLGVRLAADKSSGMPLRPDWEQPRVLAG